MRARRIRRPWLRVPPLVLAALVFCSAAAAGPVRVAGVDTSAYPELRVSVISPPGTRSPGLREDGVPVTGLEAYNLGHAKSVVLCVDRSQSMRGTSLSDAIDAARAFIAAKGGADRIEVVTFGQEAFALTRFSSTTADADAALRHLTPDPKPGTALWDAVALAAKRVGAESQPGHVIIVLTDGADVSSHTSFGQAISAAHKAGASVYTIGIAGRDFTPAPLRELAAKTGGTYHEASSTTLLAQIYTGIGRTLSHTWELRYPTAARPGEEITLTALVPGYGHGGKRAVIGGAAAAIAPAPALLSKSVWASSAAPVVVSLLVGLFVLLACGFVLAARHGLWVRNRLEPHIGKPALTAKERRKRNRLPLKQRILTATEHAFANVRQFRALERMLERADLPLRASELVYICLGGAMFFGLLGVVLLSSPVPTMLLIAAGGALPVMFVKFKAGSRIKAFDNQLPDLLITVSASLKAGHSFRHAIQAVVDEGAQPTSKEFARVLSETQLGRSMDQALGDMAERVGSKNLTFVMTAVTIQRQVGGTLAGLFDMVADTVRQRQQFARKIKGLTAMGRMSAYVLIGLPFFIALVVTVMNPGYMAPLYNTSTGHMLIAIGLVMMTFGSLILKKMVAFAG